MSYILNYTSIFNVRHNIDSRFKGSSKFKVIDDELIETVKDTRDLKALESNEKKAESSDDKLEADTIENESSEKQTKAPKKKVYKLNKTKVKRKCFALSRLNKSKQFLAFYSISFPLGLTDESAYKVFNTWLTRCRKKASLKTYLWVAERQKNGTIHFHLLTNDFMPIQTVNKFMAAALKTEKKKGNPILKEVETDKYNGVDVKKVGQNKNGIISYLAKYVSKNQIEFYRLPWHCSRDVSRLFTSTVFDAPDDERYFEKLPESGDNYTEEYTDEVNYIGVGFKFRPDESIFEELDSVNETIYNLSKN